VALRFVLPGPVSHNIGSQRALVSYLFRITGETHESQCHVSQFKAKAAALGEVVIDFRS
jgi:hypothetical protein